MNAWRNEVPEGLMPLPPTKNLTYLSPFQRAHTNRVVFLVPTVEGNLQSIVELLSGRHMRGAVNNAQALLVGVPFVFVLCVVHLY
jgi:hypothetical protein